MLSDRVAAHAALADTLVEVLHRRAPRITAHSLRAATLAVRLAKALRASSDVKFQVWVGGRLHDIGKVILSDDLLAQLGPLSAYEAAQLRQHPAHGYWMLSALDGLREVAEVVYAHHERWDGSGYPRRLQSEAIPLAARIFAVADVYDALITDRPDRAGLLPLRAITFVAEHSGKLFDPVVVEAFLNLQLQQKPATGPLELADVLAID